MNQHIEPMLRSPQYRGASTKRTYTNESKEKQTRIDERGEMRVEGRAQTRGEYTAVGSMFIWILAVGPREIVNQMCSTASNIPKYLYEYQTN